MEFTYSEEQLMIRDMVRDFVTNEVKPRAEEIERTDAIPKELLGKAAELGLFGLAFPEEYGGAGAGKVGYCLMLEELARGSGAVATTIGAHQSIGAQSIFLDGTEDQKKRYLPALCRGEQLAAYCLTEPASGSDAAGLQTTADPDGDSYVLNGEKIWVTNGGIAEVYIVFALTDKALRAHGGVTAFIVEGSFPGLKRGKPERKMGLHGSSTTAVSLENVRVPKSNVLGEIGKGFITAMRALDVGRLSLGAGCCGAAKEMIDVSIKYAQERRAFGGPIAEKEAIQFMLAEMAADIYVMESIVYRTAWAYDAGQKISREAAIVKFVCSEAGERVVDKALQIHGGMGYSAELPVERYYRDARVNRIFEGTNEIQRLIVATDLLKKGRY
ncbi:MAG: acyl-CoA dehydrogenase family protein [Planctomycetes bacterium]|nr:acyl-CoA dehydrogenase family protein [Planctomycetota bacterium]